MKFLRSLLFVSICAFAINPLYASLSMATYNIRNFDHDQRLGIKTDRVLLAQILRDLNADFIGVEEIVNIDEFKSFIATNFKDYSLALSNCGGFGKQRLGFLFKNSVIEMVSFKEDPRLNTSANCDEGLRPAIVGHFKVKGTKFTFSVIGVHLKAGGGDKSESVRASQYKTIATIVNEIKTKVSNIVILGDFNTTSFLTNEPGNENFKDLVSENGMNDLSLNLNCTSFWKPDPKVDLFVPSILDHILISDSFRKMFKRETVKGHAHCETSQCASVPKLDLGKTFDSVSDHCPITATFE